MTHTKSLQKNLFLLTIVFLIGLAFTVGIHRYAAYLEHGLDKKTIDLKAKVRLGEYIVEDLHIIKANFYQIAITKKVKARKIIIDTLKERSESIRNALDILENGGTLRRVVRLNIQGHINDIKHITLPKSNGKTIPIETIDILPKLDELSEMIDTIQQLLDTIRSYRAKGMDHEAKQADRKLRRLYKASPAFFQRITENTRRLLYEGEQELRAIEEETAQAKQYYGYLSLLAIGITVLLVFGVNSVITRQINENGRRLAELNQELQEKIHDVQKQELFTRGLLDAQSNILVVTDGTDIIDANDALFNFFDKYETLEAFKADYQCICQCFVKPENAPHPDLYITKADYSYLTRWTDQILQNPDKPFKAAMRKNGAIHHFNIHLHQETLTDREMIMIISLSDITNEIAHQERLNSLNNKLQTTLDELYEANDKLTTLAQKDYLTGVNNRRHFFELGNEIFDKYPKGDKNLYAAVIDLDHFKKLNDTYGHAVGDEALKLFSYTVQSHLESGDVFGRLGGEEFGLLMPGHSREAIIEKCEYLRQLIQKTPLHINEKTIHFTASYGIAEKMPDDRNVDTTLNHADLALYDAKKGGRNRLSFRARS